MQTATKISESILLKSAGITAMARTSISLPLRKLISADKIKGKVFHQGPGRPDNPDRQKIRDNCHAVIEYDPNHGPSDRDKLRQGNCGSAISIYVLNVLPPRARNKAIIDLRDTLTPKGIAYVAVRSYRQIENCRSHNWESYLDGWLVYRGSHVNFQKGFSLLETQEMLLKHFTVISTLSQGGYFLVQSRK